MNRNVAIVGATDNPEKYAYKTLKMLQSHGYTPIPVNPTRDHIEGVKCYPTVRDIPQQADTVTLYVRPAVSAEMKDDIVAAHPRRVIMNPGTENEDLARACTEHGIDVVRACTLVMLSTGQF